MVLVRALVLVLVLVSVSVLVLVLVLLLQRWSLPTRLPDWGRSSPAPALRRLGLGLGLACDGLQAAQNAQPLALA